jgi:hypothetical protein
MHEAIQTQKRPAGRSQAGRTRIRISNVSARRCGETYALLNSRGLSGNTADLGDHGIR